MTNYEVLPGRQQITRWSHMRMMQRWGQQGQQGQLLLQQQQQQGQQQPEQVQEQEQEQHQQERVAVAAGEVGVEASISVPASAESSEDSPLEGAVAGAAEEVSPESVEGLMSSSGDAGQLEADVEQHEADVDLQRQAFEAELRGGQARCVAFLGGEGGSVCGSGGGQVGHSISH